MSTEPIVEVEEEMVWGSEPPQKPEPKPAPKRRAWVVVFKYIGLMNLVAESQSELVKRIRMWRSVPVLPGCASQLVPVEALSNQEDQSANIWIDPHLIQAVLNEYVMGMRPVDPMSNNHPAVVVIEQPDVEEPNG